MKEKERKTSQIVIRLLRAERAWLEQEAEQRRLDLSSYIRMTLLKQVRVQLPQREAA